MDYLTVTQAAEKWGVSSRRVRLLCANGEIEGVIRQGIPLYDTRGYGKTA